MSNRSDFLMDPYGDLYLDSNGVRTTESIRQAILIRLRWFLGEWLYGPRFGVDYFGQVFVKNPNKVLILRTLADQINAVEGVKSVSGLKLVMNNRKRTGEIFFNFTVDSMELYWKEMNLWRDLVDGEQIVYDEDEHGNLRARTRNGIREAIFYLQGGDLIVESTPNLRMVVTFDLVNGDLIANYLV